MKVIFAANRFIKLNLSLAHIFMWVGMLFFWGAFTHLFSSTEGTGTGTFQALFLPIALFFQLGAIYILLRPKHLNDFKITIRDNIFLIIACIYIILSTLWSLDGAETLRRSVALIGTTAFGLALGVYFTPNQLISFIRSTLLTIVIISVLLALFIPTLGTHQLGEFAGFWRGVLSFKNQTGWVVSLYLVIMFGSYHHYRNQKIRFIFFIFIGLLLLTRTNSSTGMIAFVFGFIAILVFKLFTNSRMFKPVIILLAILILIPVILSFNLLFEFVLELVGKDSSLTGRTSIWAALIPHIEQNFIFGMGYSAFWPNVAKFFAFSWISTINHAHNTYIELLLDLGLIGTVFCMLYLIPSFFVMFKKALANHESAILFFTLLAMIFLIGLSGKVFFVPNAGVWILFVAIVTSSKISTVKLRRIV